MPPQEIATQRLLLSPPQLADARQIIKLANDPLIAQWTLSVPSPYTEADAIFFLNMAHEKRKEDQAYIFAIRLPDEPTLMGCIGLHRDTKYGTAELGYWMGAPYRRQGYVSEAVGALIDFGFRHTEVPRIYAMHIEGNEPSGRALLANGLQYEARLEDHSVKNGAAQTALQYRILRREWERGRKQKGEE